MKKNLKSTLQNLRNRHKKLTRKLCPVFLAAIASLFPTTLPKAQADLIGVGTPNWTVTAGAPWTQLIGNGKSTQTNNPKNLTINAGGEVRSTNHTAISLGNDAVITIFCKVDGNINSGNGLYHTGPNLVEVNANNQIIVKNGASIVKTGNVSNAEAINLHGFGNEIIVEKGGLISATHSSAIWFQDQTGSGQGDPHDRNVIDNSGTIIRVGGGNVIGTSAGNGVVFYNRSTGDVEGDLQFAKGNDDLIFEAGSKITGNIDGGGGNNSLTLQGDELSREGNLNGWVKNFQTLTKTGKGTWNITGSLEGFKTTRVDDGILRITGNNSNYTGMLLINRNDPLGQLGIVEAKARSLPSNSPTTGYTDNVTNNGILRFIDKTTDDDGGIGSYDGQIVGSGRVEMTGDGLVSLLPKAANGNTYSGGTYVLNGTIGIKHDNALGAVTGPLVLGSANHIGTLQIQDYFDLAAERIIHLDGLGGRIDTQQYGLDIRHAFDASSTNLYKKGSGTLLFDGDNSITGFAVVEEGTMQFGTIRSDGFLDVGSYVEIKSGAALAFAAYNHKQYSETITGAGKVIQRGGGDLMLTGSNTFTGGTEIESDTVQILSTAPNAYEKTVGANNNAGHIIFTGGEDDFKRLLVKAASIQNHIRTKNGSVNVFETYDDLTMSGISNNSPDEKLGGAFYIAAGTTLDFSLDGNLTLSNNLADGTPNDIYIDISGVLDVNLYDNAVFVNSGIDGRGNMFVDGPGFMQIAADSRVGDTIATNATIRLVDKIRFAHSNYTQDSASALQGTGIVDVSGSTPGKIEIAGTISPDNATLTSRQDTVASADRVGKLTLTGGATKLKHITYEYDAVAPNSTKTNRADVTEAEKNPDNTRNDLVQFGSQIVTIMSGTVELKTTYNSITGKMTVLKNGRYLIFDSEDASFVDSDGASLTDADLNSLLRTNLNGESVHLTSPRRNLAYYFDNRTGHATDTQVWLELAQNSLTMDWTGGATVDSPINGTWHYGNGLMQSRQIEDGRRESNFEDGDLVHIYNPGSGSLTVTASASESRGVDLITSGLVIGRRSDDSIFNGDVSLTGLDGITTDKSSAYGLYVEQVDTPHLIPTGKLEKFGTGVFTLSNEGTNDFLDGIDIYAGTISIDSEEQDRLGVYQRIGSADGIVNFVNGNSGGADNTHRALQVVGNAQKLQNQVVVESNVKDANLNAFQETTLADLGTAPSIVLGDDSTLNLHNSGRSVSLNPPVFRPYGLYIQGSVEGSASSTVNVFSSPGTNGFTQIEKTSGFAGTTNVGNGTQSGILRVVKGATYGNATNKKFNLTKTGNLEGNGTIRTTNAVLGGTIRPDKATKTPESKSLLSDQQFATLTFQGNGVGSTLVFNSTEIDSMTREGFRFDYNIKGVNTSAVAADTPNDLLVIRGMETVTMNGGVINFVGTGPTTGDYLIIDSDQAIDVAGDVLDGINNRPAGVLWAQVNGSDILGGTPRGDATLNFIDVNATNTAGKQIWLHVNHNTLEMVWQGGDGVWASGNWKSVQFHPGDVHEYSFYDGDLVYFNDTVGSSENYTVSLDYNDIVSGMDVDMTDANSSVTIAGTGGVRAIETNPTGSDYIHGQYANSTTDTQKFATTGKLVKKGAGTLTFSNTGTNIFDKGIDINAGTVSFNNGKQLQVGTGEAIHFVGSGKLRADATAKLATNIIADAGQTGTFESGQDIVMILDGTVSGPGNMTKNGVGTVQLNSSNATPVGTTMVDNGTLRLLKDKTYQTNTLRVNHTASTTGILAGAGTYQANSVTIQGTISPDQFLDDVDTEGKAKDRTGTRYATLSINGSGITPSVVLNDFVFDYDAKAPNSTTGASNTPNDLLKLTGMTTVTIGDPSATDNVGTINFFTGDENYLATGKYLIIDSDTDITLGYSLAVTSPGALLAGQVVRTVNGSDLVTKFEDLSVRTGYSFRFNDSSKGSNEATLAKSQIWLDAELNTLQMNLTDAGGSFVWNTTDDIWTSQQVSDTGIQETVFRNGDFAYLGNSSMTDGMKIELGGDIVVSGLSDGKDGGGTLYDGDVTITGDYGITSIKQNGLNETYIVGRYAKTSGTAIPDNQEFLTTGKLEKFDDGTLTFENTGGNMFTEGIDIYQGTVAFNEADQLAVGNGKTMTFLGVSEGEATLRADESAELNTAIAVDAGKYGTLHTDADINMFVNKDITGTGTLSKTGAGAVQLSSDRDRSFNGSTNIAEGAFRVTGGKTFGSASNNGFTIEVADANHLAALEGNGTIATQNFQANENSIISPDNYDLSDPASMQNSSNKIGRLIVDGAGTGSASLNGFTMNYDIVAPNNTDNNPAHTLNDLLQFSNMNTTKIGSGTISFVGSLTSGDYLIIDSNVGITVDGNGSIDGIQHGGVLQAQLNGVKIDEVSPRGDHEFVLKNYSDLDSQVWLVVQRNTLTMNRNTGGDWFGNTDWTSTQYIPIIDANPPTDSNKYAHSFENGDYVNLISASGVHYTLNLNGDALVSGLDVDSAGEIIIDGIGSILATSDLNNPHIEGIYINDPTWTNDRNIIPSGKLYKNGSGDLVFRNTGGNDFENGIFLKNGTLGFNRANQLGTTDGSGVDNGINFIGDSVLRADASLTLGNKIDLVNNVIGSIQVVQDGHLDYNGEMSGNASSTLKKTGDGTLNLYSNNVQTKSLFAGAVDMSEGTLGVYANYENTVKFTVQSGATLTGWGTIGAQNGGLIKSGGHLAPNGLSTFVSANQAPTENPLTIKGNLTFESGSHFDVRITQFNNGDDKLTPYSDCVVVENGSVSIDPDANLNVEFDFWGDTLSIFDFNAEQSGYFTVIDASAASDYSGDGFVLNLSNILPRGVVMQQGWDPEGSDGLFQLWFDKGNGFEDICPKHNRNEIGKTLDQLVWNRDPGLKNLIDHLSDPDLSDSDVCDILDNLTGDLTANAGMMALKKPWRNPFNRLSLEQGGCSPCGATKVSYKRQLWGEFYGRYDDVRYDGNAHPFTVNRYGVVVGVDQKLSRRSIVGISFNYSDPRLRQNTGKVEMDDYEIGLYGMTKFGGNYQMKLYAGYSHQRYDVDRRVYIPGTDNFAALHERFKSKTDGNAFSASVELTRPIRYRSNLLLLPTIAFDFEQAWMKGYSEKGGLTALKYDDSTLERMMFRFGLGTEYAVRKNLDLKTRIQYATQVNSIEYPRIDVQFINATLPTQRDADIWGSRIGRDYLNLGIGLDWQLNARRTTKLYINYDADVYKHATVHAGEVGLVRQW